MSTVQRLAAVGAVVVGLSNCAGEGSASVVMRSDRLFDPPTLTVGVGETVTWTSETQDAHTVTAYEESLPEGAAYFSSGGFSSEEAARDDLAEALISPGKTYAHTFDEPGTYEYFCIPHEQVDMRGSIVVEG